MTNPDDISPVPPSPEPEGKGSFIPNKTARIALYVFGGLCVLGLIIAGFSN